MMKVQRLRVSDCFVGLALLALLLPMSLFPVTTWATPTRQTGDGQVLLSAPPPENMASLAALYQEGCRRFPDTNKTVCGRFLEMWRTDGDRIRSYEESVLVMGFPLTEARSEMSLTDGKAYLTQWFERARMELHPGNEKPYDVLFGLLGVTAVQGRQGEMHFKPVSNTGDATWFPETQHTVGDNTVEGRAILEAWHNLGGLPQFGYPLSQPFKERNKGNSGEYVVQYFERQRLEYHPEFEGTVNEVLLGRLGAEQMPQEPIGR